MWFCKCPRVWELMMKIEMRKNAGKWNCIEYFLIWLSFYLFVEQIDLIPGYGFISNWLGLVWGEWWEGKRNYFLWKISTISELQFQFISRSISMENPSNYPSKSTHNSPTILNEKWLFFGIYFNWLSTIEFRALEKPLT